MSPDPALRDELLRRAKDDQEARLSWSNSSVRDWSAVEAVDRDNLEFLTPQIDRHGWLGADLVEHDGAHACWVLVQHSPAEQQTEWLPLMQGAVRNGLADERDLAYLKDRVDMHHDRRQTYGTQYIGWEANQVRLWPIDNPKGVNDRRAAIGLHPIDDADLASAWTASELSTTHSRNLID
jgi:hypothetical protein